MQSKTNKKITKVQFICMIGVILVHTYNLELYQIHESDHRFGGRLLYVLEELLSQDFGNRIAVPVFMMISAFLFYSNLYDVKEIKGKLKRRIVTIGVPYLIWNSIGTIFYLFVARIPAISNLMNGGADQITLENVLKGVFLYKYYYPFWFLLRLILFFIVSPIVFYIVRNRTLGFVAIFCCFVVNCFPVKDAYTANSFLYYLVGAYAAYHLQDAFADQRRRKESVLWILGLFTALMVQHFLAGTTLSQAVPLTTPILFWFGLNILNFEDRAIFEWETRSFFTFCAHTFVLEVFEKILNKAFGITLFGAYVDYFMAPFLTIMLLNAIFVIMKRIMPKTLNILCGGRDA